MILPAINQKQKVTYRQVKHLKVADKLLTSMIRTEQEVVASNKALSAFAMGKPESKPTADPQFEIVETQVKKSKRAVKPKLVPVDNPTPVKKAKASATRKAKPSKAKTTDSVVSSSTDIVGPHQAVASALGEWQKGSEDSGPWCLIEPDDPSNYRTVVVTIGGMSTLFGKVPFGDHTNCAIKHLLKTERSEKSRAKVKQRKQAIADAQESWAREQVSARQAEANIQENPWETGEQQSSKVAVSDDNMTRYLQELHMEHVRKHVRHTRLAGRTVVKDHSALAERKKAVAAVWAFYHVPMSSEYSFKTVQEARQFNDGQLESEKLTKNDMMLQASARIGSFWADVEDHYEDSMAGIEGSNPLREGDIDAGELAYQIHLLTMMDEVSNSDRKQCRKLYLVAAAEAVPYHRWLQDNTSEQRPELPEGYNINQVEDGAYQCWLEEQTVGQRNNPMLTSDEVEYEMKLYSFLTEDEKLDLWYKEASDEDTFMYRTSGVAYLFDRLRERLYQQHIDQLLAGPEPEQEVAVVEAPSEAAEIPVLVEAMHPVSEYTKPKVVLPHETVLDTTLYATIVQEAEPKDVKATNWLGDLIDKCKAGLNPFNTGAFKQVTEGGLYVPSYLT